MKDRQITWDYLKVEIKEAEKTAYAFGCMTVLIPLLLLAIAFGSYWMLNYFEHQPVRREEMNLEQATRRVLR